MRVIVGMRRNVAARAWCSTLLVAIATLVLSACATRTGELKFAKPPGEGSLVRSSLPVIVCTSRDAGRFMTMTGFYHPHCSQQQMTREDGWLVLAREYEDLGEGGLWLLDVMSSDDERLWVVLPWHDWV